MGIDYYRNANFNFQLYNDKETILEVFNGFSIWVKSPYNFGGSLSKNHFLTYSLQIIDRIVELKPKNESNNKLFDDPQSGKEGSFNLDMYSLVKDLIQETCITQIMGMVLAPI